jgi:hypothetical protein
MVGVEKDDESGREKRRVVTKLTVCAQHKDKIGSNCGVVPVLSYVNLRPWQGNGAKSAIASSPPSFSLLFLDFPPLPWYSSSLFLSPVVSLFSRQMPAFSLAGVLSVLPPSKMFLTFCPLARFAFLICIVMESSDGQVACKAWRRSL